MSTRSIPRSSRAQELGQHYREVRATTVRLASPLSPEDQMLQSMPDASPTKWHLAHTTWFFETFLLSPHAPGYRVFDERFRQLFNSYYKQVGAHPLRGARGLMSRPSVEEVHAYRRGVDDALLPLIERADQDMLALIELGINHEQQHQELILTDIKHALWSSPLRPVYRLQPIATRVSDPCHADASPIAWREFAGGTYEMGHGGAGFAFDNEAPRHHVLLRPFRLASRAVTNGEWLEFMADGGYRRPELWLSDGWDTVCTQPWEAPLYWQYRPSQAGRLEGEWWHYTLTGTRRVDASEPVCHVSYYEADAYARWAGARLPSEAEWEIAAVASPTRGTMLEDEVFHPCVAQVQDPRHTIQQVFGDVWEWTASPYVAYPEFRPAAGALGEYNGKFMCNQMVLRGGSCATPSRHMRATYRNFFLPQARWQFSGVRLASDIS